MRRSFTTLFTVCAWTLAVPIACTGEEPSLPNKDAKDVSPATPTLDDPRVDSGAPNDVDAASSSVAVCAKGSADCGPDGNLPRQCIDGRWLEFGRCEGSTSVCVRGECKAACVVGEIDCAGNTPRACEGGKLVAKTACAADHPVCDAGRCVACASGATMCSGNKVERCASGAWQDDRQCAGTAPECAAGACVACSRPKSCTSDRSREECAPSGAYVTTTVCSDPQTVCDGTACAACPAGFANCNDAHDGCETRLDPASGCAPCQTPSSTCYEDADGDAYGNSAVTRRVCGACPTGWVSRAGDCDDHDSVVHPGQPFMVPSPPRNADFNCDGTVTRRVRGAGAVQAFPTKVYVGSCPNVGVGCSDSYSLRGTPECGQTMRRCMDPANGSLCLDDPSSPTYTVECQ